MIEGTGGRSFAVGVRLRLSLRLGLRRCREMLGDVRRSLASKEFSAGLYSAWQRRVLNRS